MKNHLPLAEVQKRLLGLINKGYSSSSENKKKFQSPSQSSSMQLIRKIARWPHQDHLEKYCFFTSRFLKSIGQMEAISARYYQSNKPSHITEEIRPQFLAWLIKNTKGLTSIIARFEKGMTAVNNGQCYDDEFVWPCDPLPVIHGLVAGNLSDESIQPGKYRMILSDKIVSIFEVEKIDSIISMKSVVERRVVDQ